MGCILVVKDEAPIHEMVCFVLERNDFQPIKAENYDSIVDQPSGLWPDLVLLDWVLPDGSDLQFTKHFRHETTTWNIPVMMLTARGEEEDRVRSLEAGTDDYIARLFFLRKLVARIRTMLHRISPMAVEEVIGMQGLSLDPISHHVMTGEEPLGMGLTEFKPLHFFMAYPERIYSRKQLLNHVWETSTCMEDRTVDVHVRWLHKALEYNGRNHMVQTICGTGYRFSTYF